MERPQDSDQLQKDTFYLIWYNRYYSVKHGINVVLRPCFWFSVVVFLCVTCKTAWSVFPMKNSPTVESRCRFCEVVQLTWCLTFWFTLSDSCFVFFWLVFSVRLFSSVNVSTKRWGLFIFGVAVWSNYCKLKVKALWGPLLATNRTDLIWQDGPPIHSTLQHYNPDSDTGICNCCARVVANWAMGHKSMKRVSGELQLLLALLSWGRGTCRFISINLSIHVLSVISTTCSINSVC